MPRHSYYILILCIVAPIAVLNIYSQTTRAHLPLHWFTRIATIIFLLGELFYLPRKLFVIGFGICILFTVGLVFAIHHWPMGRILFNLGGFGLVTIPFMSIFLNNKYRLQAILTFIWSALYILGSMFQVNHFPAGGLLVITNYFFLSPLLTIVLAAKLFGTKLTASENGNV